MRNRHLDITCCCSTTTCATIFSAAAFAIEYEQPNQFLDTRNIRQRRAIDEFNQIGRDSHRFLRMLPFAKLRRIAQLRLAELHIFIVIRAQHRQSNRRMILVPNQRQHAREPQLFMRHTKRARHFEKLDTFEHVALRFTAQQLRHLESARFHRRGETDQQLEHHELFTFRFQRIKTSDFRHHRFERFRITFVLVLVFFCVVLV
mmetsp:Transcript_39859/g.65317  ORF Transcript_39859/g.65317 Transcript_39859/m.65317 type:complete len:203 (-) Transcript_39859:682-1290(-)